MAHKYSFVLATLGGSEGDVWKNPQEVLETMAAAGYDAVDFDCDPYADQTPFRKATDLARSLGLAMPAILNASAAWHAGEERDLASLDEAVRQRALVHFKKCVDLAATFDEPPLFQFSAVDFQPEYPVTSKPIDQLRKNFVASTREVAEYAGTRNIRLAIEPLNRFEGYAGFMNTTVEVMAVIEEVGADNLGILQDFFHMNIEDGPLTDAFRFAGDKLMHIHLADSNRQIPGTGHVDFLDFIRTLNAMGYTGYVSVDCLPPKPDWKTLVRRSIEFMKKMEETVALQEGIAAVA